MIEVTGWEPIGDGLYIEYTDGPATRYMHATPALMLDLANQHRRRREAPCGLLEAAAEALQTGEPEVAVEAWRKAYQELVDDIRFLKDRGLRHDTPHTTVTHLRAQVEGLGVATPIKVQSGLEGFIARQRGT
jgi:hypothetical protein